RLLNHQNALLGPEKSPHMFHCFLQHFGEPDLKRQTARHFRQPDELALTSLLMLGKITDQAGKHIEVDRAYHKRLETEFRSRSGKMHGKVHSDIGCIYEQSSPKSPTEAGCD